MSVSGFKQTAQNQTDLKDSDFGTPYSIRNIEVVLSGTQIRSLTFKKLLCC
jgi:hypothetical protein